METIRDLTVIKVISFHIICFMKVFIHGLSEFSSIRVFVVWHTVDTFAFLCLISEIYHHFKNWVDKVMYALDTAFYKALWGHM